MPRSYSVTPTRKKGKRFFAATFHVAAGRRVNRSLGTADAKAAQRICDGLVDLWTSGCVSPADAPIGTDADAYRLYFERDCHEGKEVTGLYEATEESIAESRIHREAERYPEYFDQVCLWLREIATFRKENARQRGEISSLKALLAEANERLTELERSVLGRAVRAGQRVPSLPHALVLFARHMRANTTRANARQVCGVAWDFAKWLRDGKRTRKNLAEVTADDVGRYLDARASGEKKAAGRDALRRRVGRCLNWSAERWEYPSQMKGVRAVKKIDLERERGEIHWHQVDEVEAAVVAQENDYWKALVACLAYAGLQLAELVWLRRDDLSIAKGGRRAKLWVSTVEDPSVPDVRHVLKTGHRRRLVDVHPKYLLPRLRKHLRALPSGPWLFPVPEGVRRRRREKNRGDPGRWIVGSLSIVLRGHRGGSSQEIRKASPGKLPAGMTAKSLRRTFGSLLIRSGKSEAEVAAAMGNTPEVVRRHYARILGCEVDVDF